MGLRGGATFGAMGLRHCRAIGLGEALCWSFRYKEKPTLCGSRP